jgi:hypothetical protein
MRQNRIISWLIARSASLLTRYGWSPPHYGTQMLLTDDEEMNLIEEFRRYKAQGMQQGGTVGGCGGCPSAGECGPEIV